VPESGAWRKTKREALATDESTQRVFAQDRRDITWKNRALDFRKALKKHSFQGGFG
jgi:hypothetical protein